MTNREKYKEQLLDITCSGSRIAVNEKTGEPVKCDTFDCHKCEFDRYFGPCKMHIEHWCESEYEEPSIDWSKVPVDTPILVSDSECGYWAHRYFAKYENGQVYAWCDGCTSWSRVYGDEDYSPWKYAKMAEESDKT